MKSIDTNSTAFLPLVTILNKIKVSPKKNAFLLPKQNNVWKNPNLPVALYAKFATTWSKNSPVGT